MIKKAKVLSLVFVLFTSGVFSQITVTDLNLINPGDFTYEALDSTAGSAIQIGPSGTNQTWDFSSLQEQEKTTTEYVDPIFTNFGFMYPTANICALGDDQDLYINKSSTGVEMVGIDETPITPLMLLPLPLTYGLQYSTGPVLALDQKEENPFLPDSLAPYITMFAAHTVDSIGVQVTFENTFNVDAWGDVIVPMGTFEALRLYLTSTSTTNYFVYCTDTLFGTGSGWYPMPQQFFPSETDETYAYQWWSNDPASKFTLVNIEVDQSGQSQGYVQFLTDNSTSVLKEIDGLNVNIFPVPVNDVLTIQVLDNKEVTLSLFDVMGRVFLKDSFFSDVNLDMRDYPSGIYYLKLNVGHKETTKKIILY